MRLGSHEMTPIRLAGLAVGAFAWVAMEMAPLGLPREARHAAGLAALMVLWWIFEAVPIAVTALVPLILYPLLRVFPEKDAPHFLDQLTRAAAPYVEANIFLFLGGMGIAAAMERWNLHRRVALTILRALGGGSSRLVLGFLVATAFISLWISNTATAVMMVPIAIAVLRRLEEEAGRKLPHLALALLLAVAYASNVGGIGTKIGTAPNVIFCQSAEKAGQSVSFLEFAAIGLPFVLLLLPFVWWALAREARRDEAGSAFVREAIESQLRALGPPSRPERWILLIFGVTAALWIFGKPISSALGMASSTPFDASVAMGASFVLFVAPLGQGRRALDLAAIRKIPISVLVLLGGSFAMAEGIGASGLVELASKNMEAVASWPPLLVYLAVAAFSVALSAAASNTGTTTLMMGVLRGLFPGTAAVPIMATSAIAASCDFMLPAGTPPNAVVFGTGLVPIRSMVRIGAGLDLIAAILAGLWGYFAIRFLL